MSLSVLPASLSSPWVLLSPEVRSSPSHCGHFSVKASFRVSAHVVLVFWSTGPLCIPSRILNSPFEFKQPPQPKYWVLEGHTYVALKQITPKSSSFRRTVECGHVGTSSWNYSCFWVGLNLILQREAAVKFLRCWAYFIILTLMFKIFFLYLT